jgi:hypothetical protein
MALYAETDAEYTAELDFIHSIRGNSIQIQMDYGLGQEDSAKLKAEREFQEAHLRGGNSMQLLLDTTPTLHLLRIPPHLVHLSRACGQLLSQLTLALLFPLLQDTLGIPPVQDHRGIELADNDRNSVVGRSSVSGQTVPIAGNTSDGDAASAQRRGATMQ